MPTSPDDRGASRKSAGHPVIREGMATIAERKATVAAGVAQGASETAADKRVQMSRTALASTPTSPVVDQR